MWLSGFLLEGIMFSPPPFTAMTIEDGRGRRWSIVYGLIYTFIFLKTGECDFWR